MTTAVPTHAIHLRLVQRVGVSADRACSFFTGERADWLGTPEPTGDPAVRRYLTDLSLPVRERAPHVVFKKAAFVDIGRIRPISDGCEVEISWRSSSLAPLFPVFAGHLVVTTAEIRLEGYYAPPGGELGIVLDRAFLNIAARGTGRWFLERVVDALVTPAQSRVIPIVEETDAEDGRGQVSIGIAGAIEARQASPLHVDSIERTDVEDVSA